MHRWLILPGLWLVPLHINCLFAPQVVLKGDAKKLQLYGVSVLG